MLDSVSVIDSALVLFPDTVAEVGTESVPCATDNPTVMVVPAISGSDTETPSIRWLPVPCTVTDVGAAIDGSALANTIGTVFISQPGFESTTSIAIMVSVSPPSYF